MLAVPVFMIKLIRRNSVKRMRRKEGSEGDEEVGKERRKERSQAIEEHGIWIQMTWPWVWPLYSLKCVIQAVM